MLGRAVGTVPDRTVSFFGIAGLSVKTGPLRSPRIAIRGETSVCGSPLPVASVATRLGLSPCRETSEPDLCIAIATADSLPDLQGPRIAIDERGTLVRTRRGWACRGAGYHVELDTASRRAHLTIADGPDVSATARCGRLAYGMRHALTSLLPLCGWHPLHAAALAAPSASGSSCGVLLVGPSGTGKSTLAAGLIQRGWECASDDLLVVLPDAQTDEAGPTVTGLSRGIRLLPDAHSRLNVTPSGDTLFGSESKAWHDVPPAARVSPTLLIVPTIADRAESRLRPLDSARAFGAVLEQMHPVRVLPASATTSALSAAGRLVRNVAPFSLEAGRDLYADPGCLADLLAAEMV